MTNEQKLKTALARLVAVYEEESDYIKNEEQGFAWEHAFHVLAEEREMTEPQQFRVTEETKTTLDRAYPAWAKEAQTALRDPSIIARLPVTLAALFLVLASIYQGHFGWFLGGAVVALWLWSKINDLNIEVRFKNVTKVTRDPAQRSGSTPQPDRPGEPIVRSINLPLEGGPAL